MPSDKEDKKPIIKIHLNKFTDFISSQLDIYRFRLGERIVYLSSGLVEVLEEVEMTDIGRD